MTSKPSSLRSPELLLTATEHRKGVLYNQTDGLAYFFSNT